MTTKALITTDEDSHVAKLANLQLAPSKISKLQTELESILEYVQAVQKAPTDKVPETSQVTGLTNVWREDVVDDSRTFTQEQALSNAKSTHNGYFMVKAILA